MSREIIVDFDVFFDWRAHYATFFSTLTKSEAEEYLRLFLDRRDSYVRLLWDRMRLDGLVDDDDVQYDEKNLDAFYRALIAATVGEVREKRLRRREPAFSEELKSSAIGMGFYIAQCVIRANEDFRWKVGHRPVRRYVDENAPVVSNQKGKHDGDDWNPVAGIAAGCIEVVHRHEFGKPQHDSISELVSKFVSEARRMQ